MNITIPSELIRNQQIYLGSKSYFVNSPKWKMNLYLVRIKSGKVINSTLTH